LVALALAAKLNDRDACWLMTSSRSEEFVAGAAPAAPPMVARASLDELVDTLYGHLPAPPDHTRAQLLHEATVVRWQGARLQSWAVHCSGEPAVAFGLQLMLPAGVQRPPVVACGDGCWAYLDAESLAAAAQRGVAVAWFNRTQVSADPPAGTLSAPRGALHDQHGGAAFGALSAWAWALHRVVDVLVDMPDVDARRIGVAGHSRGGKAALLAGALDARIALTAANNSGTLGAASSFVRGEGNESVDDLATAFPHWVGSGLRERRGAVATARPGRAAARHRPARAGRHPGP
jgi:dienelactone hydrolase